MAISSGACDGRYGTGAADCAVGVSNMPFKVALKNAGQHGRGVHRQRTVTDL
jgi:hypothetical protein